MWVGGVHGVFETGSIVDRPAPGIGDQKLDSVRQPLLHESLERVIGRVRDRHPKMLPNTGIPSGGQPAPVVGSQSGEEYLRSPTSEIGFAFGPVTADTEP